MNQVTEPKSSGPLSDVLVMLAPYGNERQSTAHFVSVLQSLGVTVLKAQAKAEVSLTRCVLAAAGYDALRQCPHLNWVFWLDQDVSGDMFAVQNLIQFATALRLDIYPSVSGVYVNRHTKPPRVAAAAVRRMDPLQVSIGTHDGATAVGECVPALCGLGCLLQHRTTFMQHCDESEHFAFPNRDTIVPEVCTSHRIHSSDFGRFMPLPEGEDIHYWCSEDFDYCIREFEHGRLVFTVPVHFGHECDYVLWPDGNCVYPGLRPPNGKQAEAG